MWQLSAAPAGAYASHRGDATHNVSRKEAFEDAQKRLFKTSCSKSGHPHLRIRPNLFPLERVEQGVAF